jgi:hypothetical protein
MLWQRYMKGSGEEGERFKKFPGWTDARGDVQPVIAIVV